MDRDRFHPKCKPTQTLAITSESVLLFKSPELQQNGLRSHLQQPSFAVNSVAVCQATPPIQEHYGNPTQFARESSTDNS